MYKFLFQHKLYPRDYEDNQKQYDGIATGNFKISANGASFVHLIHQRGGRAYRAACSQQPNLSKSLKSDDDLQEDHVEDLGRRNGDLDLNRFLC